MEQSFGAKSSQENLEPFLFLAMKTKRIPKAVFASLAGLCTSFENEKKVISVAALL